MMVGVKMLLVLAATVGVAFAVAGCSGRGSGESTPDGTSTVAPDGEAGAVVPPTTGTTHGTLQFGGRERTYRLFVPAGLKDGAKLPLVVALHGGLGSGDQFAGVTNFEAMAQGEGFVVVFPDGVSNTWNGGGCCGQAAKQKVDDVGFLAELIGVLVHDAPVDPARVFMTGHSNGAIMAFRFGCERPELVKGIAPVAGSLEVPNCAAKSATNLLAIHGDADQNHPINGGQGSRSIAGVDFISMEKTLALWTGAMGCGGTPSRQTSGALTTTEWSSCRDGVTARYIVIKGADHPWPGGPSGALGSVATKELDASKVVWAFFKGLG
ncbi:MAG: PHB depolymerase family esterase [bacterium]